MPHTERRDGPGRPPRTDGRESRLVRVALTDAEYERIIEQTDPDQRRIGLMDRTQQVDWLKELASNLVEAVNDGETAADVVAYARSDEGTRAYNIDWPGWFSNHDRWLLVEMVEQELD